MSDKVNRLSALTQDEIIAELDAEWNIEEFLEFHEFNIAGKLQKHAFELMRYKEQLEREKYDYDKILEFRDTIVGQQYQFYKNNSDELLQKSEIEKYYLPSDSKVQKINKIVRNQKVRVDYFKMCYDGLDKMYWNMKSYIDSAKFL